MCCEAANARHHPPAANLIDKNRAVASRMHADVRRVTADE